MNSEVPMVAAGRRNGRSSLPSDTRPSPRRECCFVPTADDPARQQLAVASPAGVSSVRRIASGSSTASRSSVGVQTNPCGVAMPLTRIVPKPVAPGGERRGGPAVARNPSSQATSASPGCPARWVAGQGDGDPRSQGHQASNGSRPAAISNCSASGLGIGRHVTGQLRRTVDVQSGQCAEDGGVKALSACRQPRPLGFRGPSRRGHHWGRRSDNAGRPQYEPSRSTDPARLPPPARPSKA
jgi:hypothetical protein